VLARQNDEVDDGWLCDAGRFAYPALGGDERLTEPMIRDGGELRPVSWERALQAAASGLSRAGSRTGAIAGGQASSEEGFLLARLLREGLGSSHLDSRRAGTLPLELHRALSDPALQAKVSDLEFAHAVLVLDADPIEDMPILDLRLRKGVRRHGMKLVKASSEDLPALRELALSLGQAGEDVVILWSERLTEGPNGPAAAQALLEIATSLSMSEVPGAGLLEIPAGSNGRGLREAGVLPNAGPGLREPDDAPGKDARAIAAGLTGGELAALYLFQTDPLHDLPDRELWERALERASTVVAHATFLTDGLRTHADVVFPAEAYAEKEGTVVHPDGRLQRLRPAVARVGEFGSTRAGWQVLADLASRLDLDLGVLTSSMAFRQLVEAVPFYAGLTLEEIGGRGVRWQEREASGVYPVGERV
jgi:NADH-quinone oxidoreductase subunit G